MKRLVILLILLPVILLAQQQAHDVGAINLQSMSSAMSNDQCTKVADIHITDNGEYTTMVVFLHDTTTPGPVTTEAALLQITEITPAQNMLLFAGPPEITGITPIENMHLSVDPFITGEIITPVEKILLSTNPPEITGITLIENMPFYVVPLEITEITAIGNTLLSAGPPKIAGITPIENMPAAPPRNPETRMPVENMHLSEDGYSLLQKLEGYSPDLYSLNDGGYTIGFGFFVPYNEGYKWNKGITWEAAEEMIQQKVPAYEDQVKEYVNVPLTQNEFDALTMLAYNLGGFSKATSIINDINEQVDLDKLQSDWKRFVHSKAPGVTKGLMNRRKDEIEVRKSSNYQPDRKIQIFKSKR